MEKTDEKSGTIEDIANSIREKYKGKFEERREQKEEGDLLTRAEKEFGLDSGTYKEDPLERIKERGKKLEQTLNDCVKGMENPRSMLSPLEKTKYHSLAIFSKDKAGRYAEARTQEKVTAFIEHQYLAAESERVSFEQDIKVSNSTIKSLITKRHEIEKKHDRNDRFRIESERKLQENHKEMISVSNDLDRLLSEHSEGNTVNQLISGLQNYHEQLSLKREAYAEVIQQAVSRQEGANEQYDTLTHKLEMERGRRAELRKYHKEFSTISRRYTIYLEEGFNRAYKEPIKRIQQAQQVMKDSVATLNKLIEASYISQEIFADFPPCEVPSVGEISKGSPKDYNENLQLDRELRKGAEVSKTMHEKRKAQYRTSYLVK